jgi:hypothetical protein
LLAFYVLIFLPTVLLPWHSLPRISENFPFIVHVFNVILSDSEPGWASMESFHF